jgi:hypothetical protein
MNLYMHLKSANENKDEKRTSLILSNCYSLSIYGVFTCIIICTNKKNSPLNVFNISFPCN